MKFRGCMVALVTPFREGQLDRPALERLIDLQLSEGTDGLVLCGTTGESPTLTEDEHRLIVQTGVKRASGKCPVVVGAGTNSTARTLQLSQEALDLGADGLMLVTPYYNKPTQFGLYEHFAYVAGRVKLPIMLYNIPGRCGVEIAQDTICRLFKDFESVTAVKHATGSVESAAALHAVCGIDILSGDDPITLPLLSVGAVGVVSVLANLLPARVKAMTDAFLAGDFQSALAVHAELFGLSKTLLALETNPLPIKTALAMKGLIAEEFRLPMCKMQPDNRQKLSDLLTRAGLL